MKAERMALATHRPMLDRRAAVSGEIEVEGVVLPRAGDAAVTIDGRALRFTHMDRILWPEAGFTKADLVAYYLAVAPKILPHLADRPLTVGRFPGGVDGRGFAQSEIPGRPAWMRAVPLALANGKTRLFTLADERAALAWLAQMGAIELHTFLGALPDLERPRDVLFDLDPAPPAGILECAEVALRVRERVPEAWVKTSGSLGMHVLAPARGATYAETRAFASRVAGELAREMPARVATELARHGRAGKVLIDVRQNARRLTTVVAWSLRAAPWPTISAPVAWDAVEAAVHENDAGSLVSSAVRTCR